MRKIVLALSAASLALPAALPAPAIAHSRAVHRTRVVHHTRIVHVYEPAYARPAVAYAPPAAVRCEKPSGTTGLILGAAAGAFAGREIDKGGDRTTGTLLGGALGALVGRHVERNVISRCR